MPTVEAPLKEAETTQPPEVSPGPSERAPEEEALRSPGKDDKANEQEQHSHEAIQNPGVEATPAAEVVPDLHPQNQKKVSATPLEKPKTQAAPPEQRIVQKEPPFTISFPLDSSIPLPSAQPVLAQTVHYLQDNPALPIEIEGYANREGSEKHNIRLGYWRAEAFRDYLLEAGIKKERFRSIISYGGRQPLCDEWQEECLLRNRRAVLLMVIPPEN
jgi:outer membrane protein OmpA-like peptidoglycan-associated protein